MTSNITDRILVATVIGLILLSLFRSFSSHAGQNKPLNFDIPEFTQQSQSAWLNSEPLTRQDLIGQVTLIDFWTFECWNCYRSFPWLVNLESRLKDTDFQVIGIHSPEFEHEKDPNRVANKAKKYNLHHPVMIDNDMAYWRAMQNRYWPAFYLIDRKGKVRHLFIGETHANTAQAKKIESAIESLLSEK